MKSAISIFMMVILMTGPGCWLTGTKDSPQGGVVTQDEEFSITVPSSSTTIKQGEETTVIIALNRDAYFKRDVMLEISSDGIGVTPTNILMKASGKPDLQLLIKVGKDIAIGEYRIAVKGTPESGRPTSTEFVVEVVSQ